MLYQRTIYETAGKSNKNNQYLEFSPRKGSIRTYLDIRCLYDTARRSHFDEYLTNYCLQTNLATSTKHQQIFRKLLLRNKPCSLSQFKLFITFIIYNIKNRFYRSRLNWFRLVPSVNTDNRRMRSRIGGSLAKRLTGIHFLVGFRLLLPRFLFRRLRPPFRHRSRVNYCPINH